jgi:hypothetical protein
MKGKPHWLTGHVVQKQTHALKRSVHVMNSTLFSECALWKLTVSQDTRMEAIVQLFKEFNGSLAKLFLEYRTNFLILEPNLRAHHHNSRKAWLFCRGPKPQSWLMKWMHGSKSSNL